MAAVALQPSILAHGGVGGALLEVGLTIGILSLFIAVWIRERRARRTEGENDDDVSDEQLFHPEEGERDR